MPYEREVLSRLGYVFVFVLAGGFVWVMTGRPGFSFVAGLLSACAVFYVANIGRVQ